MYSITYIGTNDDKSESVTVDGVLYERGEAVHAKSVENHIKDNPTFNVEKIEDEEKEEPKEETNEDEKPAPEKVELVKTIRKAPAKKATTK